MSTTGTMGTGWPSKALRSICALASIGKYDTVTQVFANDYLVTTVHDAVRFMRKSKLANVLWPFFPLEVYSYPLGLLLPTL